MRAVLKGTKIYFDDDLTLLQQEHKQEDEKGDGSQRSWKVGHLPKWKCYYPGENRQRGADYKREGKC